MPLRSIKEQNSVLFADSPVAMSICWFPSGKYVAVNKAYTELVGYTTEEVHDHTPAELGIVNVPRLNRHIETFSKKGNLSNVEIQLRTKGGKHRTVLLSSRVFPTDEGNCIFNVLIDIEAQKRSESNLLDSERNFENIFLNGTVPTTVTKAPNYEFVLVNKAWQELIGYTQEEVVGKTGMDLGMVPVPEQINSQIEQYSVTGNLTNMKTVALTKSKELLTILLSVRPIVINGEEFALGTVQDVTVRERVEKENAKLLSAIDQTQEAVFTTDIDGNIEFVNPAFETITGYSEADVIGKHPRMLNSPKNDSALFEELWATIRDDRTWTGQMLNVRKDGSTYVFNSSISPVKDIDGNTINFVSVSRDVTKELELTQRLIQSEKLEAMGSLAGGVAHDYNNALSIIMGYAELARGQMVESDPSYAYLTEILNATKRSAEITKQLLSFARKQTIHPVTVDLNDIVDRSLSLLHRTLGENCDLRWHPSSAPLFIRIDPAQIDLLLVNLCTNARDSINTEGVVRVATTVKEFDEAFCAANPDYRAGKFVELSVKDNGQGIGSEMKSKIFEPFFTTKEVGKGTGLGLPTVYGIAEQNNGFIVFDSVPKIGTEFKVYFRQVSNVEANELLHVDAQPNIRFNHNILLVEDEPALLKLTEHILKQMGCNVTSCSSPVEALQIASDSTDIDLLLTDVVMPQMNGKDLAYHIQAKHPHVLTLFMSGYAENITSKYGINANVHNFIQKPFTQVELFRKLAEVMSH